MRSPKTIFAAFSFLLFSFTGIAQVKLVRNIYRDPIDNGWHNWFYDHKKDMPATGKFIIYLDSNYTHTGLTGEYKDGKRTGTWTSYYLNGRKLQVESYKDDMYDGKVITFFMQGDTAHIENYIAGKHEGRSIYWSDKPYSPGRFISTVYNYKAGTAEGWQLQFDWNGDTLYKELIIDGKTQGKAVSYKMGRIVSEAEYVDGKRKNTRRIYDKPEELYELDLYFTSEKQLTLARHKLDSLAYFINLRTLTIRVDVKYANEIPGIVQKLDVIKNFKHLESIRFTGQFTEIPPVVFSCKHLTELNLTLTLIPVVPAAISGLASIRKMDISGNSKMNYSASLKNMSALTQLRYLVMPLDFGKPLPTTITLLQSLYFLSLGNYSLCTKDTTPVVNMNLIYQLKNLRAIELCVDQYWKVDQFAFAKKMPNCRLGCYETCFSAGTQITLANGSKKEIENIRPGDVVLSYDDQSGCVDTTIVNWIYTHAAPMEGVIVINYFYPGATGEFGTLRTTAIHPFYSSGKWVKAAELKKGDKISYYSEDGSVSEIIIQETELVKGGDEHVYNLRTNKHTFIVNGVVVHNK
jgi:antitoxin component YwqK of YwqJK toxin-antitoxin module